MAEISRILQVALPTPLNRLFDYLAPEAIDITTLKQGMRVLVPFQSRELVGILIGVSVESQVKKAKLKPIIACLDEASLFDQPLWQLALWAADYYHHSLGEVLMSALPTLLRKASMPSMTSRKKVVVVPQEAWPQLNQAQAEVVKQVSRAFNTFTPFLLDGVTGSGKTEVYLQLIREVIAQGKQALVLVPEIGLTPQMIARFRARFRVEIALTHSDLSEKVKLKTWLQAKTQEVQVVIGTRSAIFTSFKQLGLIIVDEEHDPSFKQQDRFRYHARDLAIVRAKLSDVPIILGSATPSLESLKNVAQQKYRYLNLPARAGGASLPRFEIVDIKGKPLCSGLSNTLIQCMTQHLANHNQVLLFLNRRGFAPVLYCLACHDILGCKRCSAKMVYHHGLKQLKCHYCDARKVYSPLCATCGESALQPIGLGTERIEMGLKTYFPDVDILRIDRDTTRKKNALQALLEEVNAKPKAILLGTQMLAKGHHFPRVTLVGVIDADAGLLSADFRAAEQMGQMLLQVAGRAGREKLAGEVVLQTRNRTHPLLQSLVQEGYAYFANRLLLEREAALLPPFTHLALIKAESYAEYKAEIFLNTLKNKIMLPKDIVLHGPMSAIMSKKKGLYCYHLIVKSKKRATLQTFLSQLHERVSLLKEKSGVKWVLDVDPLSVM